MLEERRFDLVLSGSLLGVELKDIRSFPVGYLHIEHMYPLDFEEFCWSQGVPADLLEKVRTCYLDKTPVEATLHEKLQKLYRFYITLGGMPEVIKLYLDSHHDLSIARSTAQEIITLYRKDIAKDAKTHKLQIKSIFDTIPSELAKENKRFHIGTLKEGGSFDRYDDDFSWLIDAGVALPTYLVSEPTYPLIRTKKVNRFKLYSSDVGLLIAQYPPSIVLSVIEGSKNVNFGAVYENVIAQELQAAGFALYYYHNNRKGEVDFLLESDAKIIPIEVKSGKDYKLHTALNNLLKTTDYPIDYAYVLSENNVSQGMRENKPVYYLPLYMSFCLNEENKEDLSSLGLQPPTFS